MDSPNTENILFLLAHRLLVIALRRGIIQGIETINELINTDLANITIKPENLNDTVF